jgi:hypothetical protein
VGNYHPLLKLKFRALAGVGVSSACVGTARKRNADVDYQVYDGTTLPYADGSFDLAFPYASSIMCRLRIGVTSFKRCGACFDRAA